ncbi:NTP transferase domain-containing protein [Auraticoccus sp. F435]|uniref:NTP transferase domain-containing protein n=1 Tax=Auraticoccus cholistanensis TaxID=2656650 RepID=A0A6A9V1E6_9ACTN|nr:glucose-1-phosphate cytidylyltransferase [Auraticoccus cholistanensis]MVA77269.1 NTP transferase domain-containing protein [Auraticoccus cholistanensis]
MSTATPPAFDPADIPVVILCGGMGTRLREASEKLPKPLVDVGGKPILWHVMKTYSHYGFRRFVLCLGYKGDQIRRYFLEYRERVKDFTLDLAADQPPTWHGEAEGAEDWQITFAETGLLTGTAGRVRRVAPYLDRDLFLLTYGDGIGAVDIRGLVEQHLASGRLATVTGVHPSSRYGEMHVSGEQVMEFNEKPTLATGWVSGGFFAFDRLVIDKYLDDDDSMMLEKRPLQTIASDGELGVFKHEGFWMGMDTFRDWTELNALWDGGNPPWKVWQD